MQILNQKIPHSWIEFKNIILENKGFDQSWFNSLDPFQIQDEEAGLSNLDRIVDLIRANFNKKFLIVGDYDCDGICSTTIIYKALSRLGCKVRFLIPDRETEGYGLSAKVFQQIQQLQPDIVITVDNGITAIEWAKKIRELGIKFILTDHHEQKDIIPENDGIAHSTKLCGAGVIWFVVRKLIHDEAFIRHLLSFVALATIADVINIDKYNRSLILGGFEELRKNQNLGLVALMQVLGIDSDTINSNDIGFNIAPCLNAMGRLKTKGADIGVELLNTQDYNRALEIANIINTVNQERKDLTTQAMIQAESGLITSNNVIIATGDFKPGIVGLLAGKITEKYYKPTLVISTDGDVYHGSARSIGDINITSILKETGIEVGGHTKASGFSIEKDNYKNFIQAILNKFQQITIPPRINYVDCRLELGYLTIGEIIKVLSEFEPYGEGNKRIRVQTGGVIKRIFSMGKNKEHLKITLGEIEVVKWNITDNDFEIGDKIEVCGEISINKWKKNTTVQIIADQVKSEP